MTYPYGYESNSWHLREIDGIAGWLLRPNMDQHGRFIDFDHIYIIYIESDNQNY